MNRIEFLQKIEDFLRKTGMSASAFGIKSKAEPNFVFTLRKGRECKEAIQEKVLKFIDKQELERKTDA